MIKKVILSVVLVFFFFSCSTFLQKTLHSERKIEEICFAIREKKAKLDVQHYKISENELKVLRENFSDSAISIANDIGVTEYLLEFLSLGGKNKSVSRKLIIMKEVQERVNLSQMELSSMIAIADCERDRSMQLASHLDLVTNQESNKLAMYSLFSTVSGTLAAAILELVGSTHQLYLAADVSLGLLAGYFAYQSTKVETKGNLVHKNNILRELKNKPEKPELFYSTVWNFLNNENYPSERAERDEILKLWNKDEATEADKELFLSNGGEYSSQQLYKLVSRYDKLKIRMAYMQLELRQLLEELDKKESEVM